MRQCPAKAILVARNDGTDLLVMSLTRVSKWTRQAPGPGIARGLTPARAIPARACSGSHEAKNLASCRDRHPSPTKKPAPFSVVGRTSPHV